MKRTRSSGTGRRGWSPRTAARRAASAKLPQLAFGGTPLSKWIVAGIVIVVIVWWLIDGGARALSRALAPQVQTSGQTESASKLSDKPSSSQTKDEATAEKSETKPTGGAGAAKNGESRSWPPADGEWIRGWGTVSRLLPDDTVPPCHQRFFLVDSAGRSIFVAHNIDVAKRLDSLREGDKVEFFGEWRDNDRGGVLHWTHRDSSGRRRGGWLRHNGVRYD